MDSETQELCVPHSMFHAGALEMKVLMCLPESNEAPGCIGSVELVDSCNMGKNKFAERLKSELSSKWDMFDAACLSRIVQCVLQEVYTVEATWNEFA